MQSFNISQNDTFNATVVPGLNSDPEFLNITNYTIVSHEQLLTTIQINFTNPGRISNYNQHPDILLLQLNVSYFKSALPSNTTELHYIIPRQLNNNFEADLKL